MGRGRGSGGSIGAVTYEAKKRGGKITLSFTSPEKNFFFLCMLEFFFIYDVIVKQKKRKRSANHYCGWACTSHPGVLGSIPKREEPGKTGRHPVLKYRVPRGSHLCSLVCDGQTSPHRPRLVVSRSTCPQISLPSPRKQLCTRSCSNNKHTHTAVTVV